MMDFYTEFSRRYRIVTRVVGGDQALFVMQREIDGRWFAIDEFFSRVSAEQRYQELAKRELDQRWRMTPVAAFAVVEETAAPA